ncbi:hypothetical protein F0310_04950 (plasmid) [Borrelia sp. A-FGy1]|uniref:hypothetical protein n=1 Tax=Borrelia sp. A-FGy1 TaxID=2608247 RepID=UPI0015F76D68|nr:hypothetical protein [Borrelia sp. A-FGy1]QMU99764.1 hypothetical protein F0310_04950 [Borrelia sp. A-FGy1]
MNIMINFLLSILILCCSQESKPAKEITNQNEPKNITYEDETKENNYIETKKENINNKKARKRKNKDKKYQPIEITVTKETENLKIKKKFNSIEYNKTYQIQPTILINMKNQIKENKQKINIIDGLLKSLSIFIEEEEMKSKNLRNMKEVAKSRHFHEIINTGKLTYILNFTDKYKKKFMLKINPLTKSFKKINENINNGNYTLKLNNQIIFKLEHKETNEETVFSFNKFRIIDNNIIFENTQYDTNQYHFSASYNIIEILEYLSSRLLIQQLLLSNRIFI